MGTLSVFKLILQKVKIIQGRVTHSIPSLVEQPASKVLNILSCTKTLPHFYNKRNEDSCLIKQVVNAMVLELTNWVKNP